MPVITATLQALCRPCVLFHRLWYNALSSKQLCHVKLHLEGGIVPKLSKRMHTIYKALMAWRRWAPAPVGWRWASICPILCLWASCMGSIIFVSQKSDLQTFNRDSWQHAEECYHKSATEGTSCQFAAILSGCGKSGRRLQEQTAHNRLYQ